MSLIPQVHALAIGVPQPTGMRIEDVGLLISRIISIAFILAGIMVFAFLVWGGIEWILSGGDKSGTEKARNRITSALVGLVIVFAAWAIAQLVGVFFGINIFQLTIPQVGK